MCSTPSSAPRERTARYRDHAPRSFHGCAGARILESHVNAVEPPGGPSDRSRSHSRWHVSPTVDLCAYAFSWVWVFVPLACLGDTKEDYLGWYLLILVATDVHRHYGLPYVYLDQQIRSRFKVRFTLFPAVMLGLWASSPYLVRSHAPLTWLTLAEIVTGVVLSAQVLGRDRDGQPFPWNDVGKAAGVGLLVTSLLWTSNPMGLAPWSSLFGLAAVSIALDAFAYRRADGPRIAFVVIAAVLLTTIALVCSGIRIDRPLVRPRELIDLAARSRRLEHLARVHAEIRHSANVQCQEWSSGQGAWVGRSTPRVRMAAVFTSYGWGPDIATPSWVRSRQASARWIPFSRPWSGQLPMR